MFDHTIVIQGLPKMTNTIGRKHWSYKAKEARTWKDLVGLALGTNIPKRPLNKAVVMCRRHSSKCPDYDGLVSSFKHVIDGLVEHGVLQDDSMQHIGMPLFRWCKVSPKEGMIVVRVIQI